MFTENIIVPSPPPPSTIAIDLIWQSASSDGSTCYYRILFIEFIWQQIGFGRCVTCTLFNRSENPIRKKWDKWKRKMKKKKMDVEWWQYLKIWTGYHRWLVLETYSTIYIDFANCNLFKVLPNDVWKQRSTFMTMIKASNATRILDFRFKLTCNSNIISRLTH